MTKSVTAAGLGDRALLHGALDAQPPSGLTPALVTDLVDVAVEVDGRREELGDHHATRHEHHDQQGVSPPSCAAGGGSTRSSVEV